MVRPYHATSYVFLHGKYKVYWVYDWGEPAGHDHTHIIPILTDIILI
eukprot:SAG11_NODE_29652_length_308_cov_2.196172_1_plen_46_part_10